MKVVALAGGVGGAKLVDGLARLLGERLCVIVNTGDDFEHFGLPISPDLDTVMYTLAGIANPQTGWGIAGDTWHFMSQIERLGGPAWFRLGDRDLATHAMRAGALRSGATLTAVTAQLCRALGVASRLVPMSDDPVRTVMRTEEGELAFQDYFVRLGCAVPVRGLRYAGADTAKVNPVLAGADCAAIVFCPSNPYLSIGPILAVPGMRDWIAARRVPIIAVSPIVGGAAVKGPAGKIMAELGLPVSAAAVARHYGGLIDALIVDEADADLVDEIAAAGIRPHVAPSVMRSVDERIALARICLALADELADVRRR